MVGLRSGILRAWPNQRMAYTEEINRLLRSL